jgi:hypothetical protein
MISCKCSSKVSRIFDFGLEMVEPERSNAHHQVIDSLNALAMFITAKSRRPASVHIHLPICMRMYCIVHCVSLARMSEELLYCLASKSTSAPAWHLRKDGIGRESWLSHDSSSCLMGNQQQVSSPRPSLSCSIRARSTLQCCTGGLS